MALREASLCHLATPPSLPPSLERRKRESFYSIGGGGGAGGDNVFCCVGQDNVHRARAFERYIPPPRVIELAGMQPFSFASSDPTLEYSHINIHYCSSPSLPPSLPPAGRRLAERACPLRCVCVTDLRQTKRLAANCRAHRCRYMDECCRPETTDGAARASRQRRARAHGPWTALGSKDGGTGGDDYWLSNGRAPADRGRGTVGSAD